MTGGEQIAKCVDVHAVQSHEHHWIIDVMIGEVIRRRIFRDERVALIEIDSDRERLRLCGFVDRHAREHLSAHLERRRPVRGAFFDIGQREPELPHDVEADHDGVPRAMFSS
jgi:hypothetical protein